MNIRKELIVAGKKAKRDEEESARVSPEGHKRRKLAHGFLRFFGRSRGELRYSRKVSLKKSLQKAGIETSPTIVSRIILVVSIILCFSLMVYAFTRMYDSLAGNYAGIFILLFVLWTAGLFLITSIVWLAFYLTMDLIMFQRRQKLEAVLPDFLQLVSGNIRAGMTIDQALWFAVRPRFGILAKEIEEVAKHTFAGEPLEDALGTFVKKYDSKILERSMNLLIEGVRAGGELGDLLDKISTNIQETYIIRKEMAANVTTYVIFISFATVVAAPFLFGIAMQLIVAITEIFSRVNLSQGAVTGFALQVSEGVIDIDDFRIFAIVSLIITSFFSSIIISTIKKGSVKAGIRYVPMFIAASVLLFLIVIKLFSFLVADFF